MLGAGSLGRPLRGIFEASWGLSWSVSEASGGLLLLVLAGGLGGYLRGKDSTGQFGFPSGAPLRVLLGASWALLSGKITPRVDLARFQDDFGRGLRAKLGAKMAPKSINIS